MSLKLPHERVHMRFRRRYGRRFGASLLAERFFNGRLTASAQHSMQTPEHQDAAGSRSLKQLREISRETCVDAVNQCNPLDAVEVNGA